MTPKEGSASLASYELTLRSAYHKDCGHQVMQQHQAPQWRHASEVDRYNSAQKGPPSVRPEQHD
eukprot:6465885-Amphidinium_carterae.1